MVFPLNLFLISIILISFLNLPFVLYFSFLSGLLLDLNSFLPFGTIALIFLIIALITHYLFRKFFPFFSLFSLLTLTLVATFLYYFLFFVLGNLFYFLKYSNFQFSLVPFFLDNLPKEIFKNLIILSFLFFIYGFIVKRLAKRFIIH